MWHYVRAVLYEGSMELSDGVLGGGHILASAPGAWVPGYRTYSTHTPSHSVAPSHSVGIKLHTL